VSMSLLAAEASKEKFELEKRAAVKRQEHAKGRYKRLRGKFNHYKSKSKRLLKQLSFAPYL
jgi:hypothetical protein